MKRAIPLLILTVVAALFGAAAHKWASPIAEIRNASIALHDEGLVSGLALKNVTTEAFPGAHDVAIKNNIISDK